MRAVPLKAQAAACIAVSGALLWLAFPGAGMRIYEDVTFALDPSGERAFEYGSRHFDSTRHYEYDLDRAQHFFERALSIDPEIPFVYHQLSRLAFLRGNLGDALTLINKQIEITGEEMPNSYYMRGLIRGYRDQFDVAAEDYAIFLKHDPNNWAGITDYSWVLIKAERYEEALEALDRGIVHWPENAWLLNAKATAHFELGELEAALEAALKARSAIAELTPEEWSVAYPGNDPLIAPAGVAAFRKAVEDNIHTIELAQKKAQESVR